VSRDDLDGDLREWLVTLTACGGLCVLFFGCVFILAVPFRHPPSQLIGLSLASAGYCFLLARRARRMSGGRLRRAWRNLVLMIGLCVVGVVLVGLTRQHHRHFWKWASPSLVNLVQVG
jgi:hypothetical protein